MLEASVREALDKEFRSLWIIWAGMLGSLLLYIFICHQFGEEIRRTASSDIPVEKVKNIIYVLVLITLFLAHFLRRLILAGRFSASKATISKPRSALKQSPFLIRYVTAVIISVTLSESIGIYSLLLFFLGHNFHIFYIFIAISAAAMFLYRPKREELESLALAVLNKEGTVSDN